MARRRRGHTNVLLPECRAGDNVERLLFADQFFVPILEYHRGADHIPARPDQRERGRHVHASRHDFGGLHVKLALHGQIGSGWNDVIVPPFDRDMQPIAVFAQMKGLSGKIRDADADHQRFTGQKLVLLERQIDTHLR